MKKQKQSSKERRRSERLDLPIKALFCFFKKRTLIESITENISGGGICLKLEWPIPKQNKLRISLYFPNDTKPVNAISEVVWCKRINQKGKTYYEVGIRHLKILPRDKERFVFLFCEMMINYLILGKFK